VILDLLPWGDNISKIISKPIISKPRIIERTRRGTTADCPAWPG
jgi:hypothetical protein